MTEHVWTVFCSRLVTDNETNQVSLIDVVESLKATGPQQMRDEALSGQTVVVPFRGTLTSLWSRSNRETPEVAKCRAILFDGSDQELLPYQEFDVGLREHKRLRTQFKLEVFPLRGEGQYAFQVELLDSNNEWQIVSRVPFEVSIEVKAEDNEQATRKRPRSAKSSKRKRKR